LSWPLEKNGEGGRLAMTHQDPRSVRVHSVHEVGCGSLMASVDRLVAFPWMREALESRG
jgi:hypothetical protein